MVLETNYYSRDCARGWFSFGESWLTESLGGLREKTSASNGQLPNNRVVGE
jgi:hypothetical protein